MTPSTPSRPPDRVTYGPFEPLGVSYRTWEDRPTIFGGHNWMSVRRERWGRKCYETWDGPTFTTTETAPGELLITAIPPTRIGRWYWVPEPRYRPSGAPPLPPTCARDTLEDDMGYEAATRYIGHRDALMGFPS